MATGFNAMVDLRTEATDSTARPRIAFGQFANIFIPFALLMTAALLAPELRANLAMGRTVYSIWVTMGFLIPALILFYWPGDSEARRNYHLLCWTGGLVAYLVHFYYAVGVIFHGSLAEVYAAQGPIIATSNLIDTVWWTLDVLLAWFVPVQTRWIKLQRLAVHIYLPATFFISAVIFKHGVARGLGLAMTAGLLIAVIVRWVRSRSPAANVTTARS